MGRRPRYKTIYEAVVRKGAELTHIIGERTTPRVRRRILIKLASVYSVMHNQLTTITAIAYSDFNK